MPRKPKPRPEQPPRLLTTAELADALNVHARTIERWLAEGLLRPDLRTPGGHYRWDLDRVRTELSTWERATEDD